MNMTYPTISDDEIARRAYAIWESRGCPPGDGAKDWDAARDELLAARIGRNGSTQDRMRAWWQRVREKFAVQD